MTSPPSRASRSTPSARIIHNPKGPASHRVWWSSPPTRRPTDQIRRYREYAASRFERTKAPQGPRGTLFSPDYVGTTDELADQLFDHAGFQRADEVAFALPFTFDEADYRQIITDLAEHLGPKLGWQHPA